MFQTYLPGALRRYFFVAMVVAFLVAGAAGLAVEWLLIRHLYKRPLDTLLATWGLSLSCSRPSARSSARARSAPSCRNWMMGSLQVTDAIEMQINGLFVMALTLIITAAWRSCSSARAGACRCARWSPTAR